MPHRHSKRWVLALAALSASYLISFLMVFDILDYPVRTSNGWIGPRSRFRAVPLDIGKVYETHTRTFEYRFYAPFSRVYPSVAR